ncbi:MAG TPA: hypothetical protein PLO23_00250 [Alphaproteobacteria bacterium]|nr:hypothetical protein [Alphaproteobacteria bacterium]
MAIDTGPTVSLLSPPAIIRDVSGADGSNPPLKTKYEQSAILATSPSAVAAPPEEGLYRFEDLPKPGSFSGSGCAVADIRLG